MTVTPAVSEGTFSQGPTVTNGNNARKRREHDEDSDQQRKLRTKGSPIPSWTEVVDKTRPHFQNLVEHGVLSPEERKDLWFKLVPEGKSDALEAGAVEVWSTQTLIHIIEKVQSLARACQLTRACTAPILCKRQYDLEDFRLASNQLVKAYYLCVAQSLKCPIDAVLKKSTTWPEALRLLLVGAEEEKRGTFLQRLVSFFAERPPLLSDSGIGQAAKQLIENYWQSASATLKPYSKLWKELTAGQQLLKQIDPQFPEPFLVITEDGEEFPLEKADTTVISAASPVFEAMFKRPFDEGINQEATLKIQSEDFQAFIDCFLKGEAPSRATLKSLMIIADIYLIADLTTLCLEWFKKDVEQAETPEAKAAAIAAICLVQKSLRGKLSPAAEEAWIKVRDDAVSTLLSGISDVAQFRGLVETIVSSQEDDVHWPVSLDLVCQCVPTLAPLTALENLALRSPERRRFVLANSVPIRSLSALKSLTLGVYATFADWSFLSHLPQLCALHILTVPERREELNEIVAKLTGLEALTLTPNKIAEFRIFPLPDLKGMEALRELKIVGSCPMKVCAELLAQESLENLTVTNAVSESWGTYEFFADKGEKRLEIGVTSAQLANYRMSFPHIPQVIVAKFAALFPGMNQIIFRLQEDKEREPFVWKRPG